MLVHCPSLLLCCWWYSSLKFLSQIWSGFDPSSLTLSPSLACLLINLKSCIPLADAVLFIHLSLRADVVECISVPLLLASWPVYNIDNI